MLSWFTTPVADTAVTPLAVFAILALAKLLGWFAANAHR